MIQEEKIEIREAIEKLKTRTRAKDYGDVVVEAGQTFTIKTLSSRFNTLTLKDGATLEIDNSGRVGIPFVLVIDHLYLDSIEKTSFLSFTNKYKPRNLRGDNGQPGPRARDGYWTNGRYRNSRLIAAQHARPGYNGEGGINIATRGILHFTIKRLWVTNETPLSAEIFQINGQGFNGGNGGNGGRGGKGGDGARGISGGHGCNWRRCWCHREIRSGGRGGNAGDGGFGGKGADGGAGATLFFFGKKWIFNTLKTLVNLEGGEPGAGGFGGAPGAVGIGAPRVRGGAGHCGRAHPAQPNGNPGIDRRQEQASEGDKGADGVLLRAKTAPTFETVMDQLLEELETETGYFAEA